MCTTRVLRWSRHIFQGGATHFRRVIPFTPNIRIPFVTIAMQCYIGFVGIAINSDVFALKIVTRCCCAMTYIPVRATLRKPCSIAILSRVRILNIQP